MSGRSYKVRNAIIIYLVTAIVLSGCSMLRPPSPKEEGEKKKNPPKALTQMEKDTESIIKELEQVSEKREEQEREKEHPSGEKPAQEQQGQAQQQGQQEQEGQQGQKQSQEQSGQQGQDQQQAKQQSQQQEQGQQKPAQTEQPVPKPNWIELESKMKTLHENWNAYEPSAKSDGAMNETMKGYEEQLISLTEYIIARDEEKTLAAANILYTYYPEFFKLYSHNQPPEVKEAKALTRQVVLLGKEGRWNETKTITEKIKVAWQEAKTKMKKPDKTLNSRIDAAISDFISVVSEKKMDLVKIKGDVLIKNLDKVE